MGKLLTFYDRQYKKLLIIPFLLLILAIIQIGYQVYTTGDFVEKSVSLKGGVSLKLLDEKLNKNLVHSTLEQNFPVSDITTKSLTQRGKQTAIVIEMDLDIQDKDSLELLKNSIKSIAPEINEEEIEDNIQIINPKLGESFFKAAFRALILAFAFMGIVVFIFFRTSVPSLAVILAAFSDMVITLAIFNILGFKLSRAGIAAFLMLIGYSVDTDILLTTKMLKDKTKPILDRIISAAKTGIMMNATTLVAIGAAISFALSLEIQQIMTILIIGLLVDQINTWIQNAGILRLYLEKKEKNDKV
jgi:preprotein translocase subunit SecF